MAALTNARNTPERPDGGRMRVCPVETNTNIYLGGIVALDAAGNAVPASATTTVANPLKIIGRAEYVSNGIPGQNAINNPGAANWPVPSCTCPTALMMQPAAVPNSAGVAN